MNIVECRGKLHNRYLQKNMHSILHGNHRAGDSQLKCYHTFRRHPPCWQLQEEPERPWQQMLHHPKGDLCKVGCGASARLFFESHWEFSCLLSAWNYRCPHKTVSLHISPALQAHQAVVINRGHPWDFIHEESSTFISCPLSPIQGPPLLLQILQTKPLQLALLTFSPKAMIDSSSSHQVIPSSTGTSSIFSLAPQHPTHQANEWEGTGEILQAQITL